LPARAAREEGRCDVDDDALIGSACVEYGAMDFASGDEDDVAGGKRIAAPFDDIFSIAAEEEDDFMKIVIVERDRSEASVLQAEDAKVA
jgi:hypothetical protein